MTEFTAQPDKGRRYSASRRVRLGDVSPKGRLRLDAVARYLQDVANDDAIDAIGEDASAWVVRRTAIAVERFPVLREGLTLTTWGAGVGARWAERRTSIVGEGGGHIEVVSLWVHVDLDSGRPAKLPASFFEAYGATIGDRRVHARLSHPDRPDGIATTAWPVRFVDFDVLGHVNNAAYWAIVEEHVDLHAPATVELEYRGGIDRDQRVEVAVDGEYLWITAAGVAAASARILGLV